MTRSQSGISQIGFCGLDILYDMHFIHIKSLDLPDVFSGNPIISYYCKLREKYPLKSLDEILRKDLKDLKIDGLLVDSERYGEKFINRGQSTFLDVVKTVG